MSSISDEIDQAFEEAQWAHGPAPLFRLAEGHPVLAGMSAADLIGIAVNDRVAPFVRDQLWMALIDGYRQGPTAFWGPLVLKAVMPTLLRKAARLPQEPEFDADINHQLIAAVLDAAATGKLPSPAHWTPNRLATRAVTRTKRWMAMEARTRDVYLDELPESEAGPDPDPAEFASMLVLLRTWGLHEEGSLLVLRNRVLGEPLAEIAEQLGVTEAALQMRRCRAEERIRRRLLVTTKGAHLSSRRALQPLVA
jgi:DNA-directed RNA polymerase specialized sigma24 family protein